MAPLIWSHLMLPAARAALIVAAVALLLFQQGLLRQQADVTITDVVGSNQGYALQTSVESRTIGVAASRLLAPVLACALLLLAADLTFWLGRGRGLKLLGGITAMVRGTASGPDRRLTLSILRRSLRAGALVVLAYGLIAAAPAVSEAIAGRDSTPQDPMMVSLLAGLRDTRLFSTGAIASLMAAWVFALIPAGTRGPGSAPLLQALAFGAAAPLTWSTGIRLGEQVADQGDGLAYVGATLATAFLFVALSRLCVYGVTARQPAIAQVARWLSVSKSRAFGIGLSLALYGIVLRPLFYQNMAFAPVFEWIVIIGLAAVVLAKTDRGIQASVKRVAVLPRSGRWHRHEQKIDDLPDPYFDVVAGVQRGFLDSGRTIGLWCYLMMLALENGLPVTSVIAVLGPIAGYSDAPRDRLPWPGRRRRTESRRRRARKAVLNESLGELERALAARPSGATVGPDTLHAAAAGFLHDHEALPFVVGLTAMSWQNGAGLTDSALRWSRLLWYADTPVRWHHLPWQRRRIVRSNETRRQDIVQDSVAQASDAALATQVYIAYPIRQIVLKEGPEARSRVRRRVMPYELMEVRQEVAEGLYSVCTFDNTRGYVGVGANALRPTRRWNFDNRF